MRVDLEGSISFSWLTYKIILSPREYYRYRFTNTEGLSYSGNDCGFVTWKTTLNIRFTHDALQVYLFDTLITTKHHH